MSKLEYACTIKELPEEERPRERLCKYGAEVLSNSEILAIIIRTGNRKCSAISLSQRLLSESGAEDSLLYLAEASIEELSRIPGIGTAKACQIKAAIELGRRLAKHQVSPKACIRYPDDVSKLVMEDMRYLKKEYFRIIQLNIKNQVLSIDDISIGTINSSLVHPREVFNSPVKRGSAAIILVHNHPSGDPMPSKEDVQVTKRIVEAGTILGIDVLDHIVIGDGVYTSLKEKGLF